MLPFSAARRREGQEVHPEAARGSTPLTPPPPYAQVWTDPFLSKTVFFGEEEGGKPSLAGRSGQGENFGYRWGWG